MQEHNRKVIANELFFAEAEQHFSEGRSVEMLLKGFSMRPFLKNMRDVVVLEPIRAEELQRGMVVLFRHRGVHTLHRFRGVERDGRLRMEGDGNYRIVERVGPKDVLARVVEVKRGERTIRYGTCRWRLRSAWSLMVKRLRTVAIRVKRIIKR